MASDGGSIPDFPDSLDAKFHPRKAGVLGAAKNIIQSGFGSILVALFIGIASIPTGVVLGFQKVLGGFTSWLTAFFASFFAPIQLATGCATGSARGCTPETLTLVDTSGGPLVQSAGIAGFVMAIVVAGAVIYIVSSGVSSYV